MRLKIDFWMKWSWSASNNLRQWRAITRMAPMNWMRESSDVLSGFVLFCMLTFFFFSSILSKSDEYVNVCKKMWRGAG